MKIKKKNGFLTFCCSLVPGMAHMYMGLFKMGLSLAGLFFGVLAITTMLDIGPLFFIAIIIWFYSFFHANNLASLSAEELALVKDDFLFGMDTLSEAKMNPEKYRKIFGIALVIFGIVLLWNITLNMLNPYLREFLSDYAFRLYRRIVNLVPQLIFGIIVIAFGVKMLRGKKKNLAGELPGDSDV